jgi:hypothetical protein
MHAIYVAFTVKIFSVPLAKSYANLREHIVP